MKRIVLITLIGICLSDYLLELEDAGIAYILGLKDIVDKMAEPEVHAVDYAPHDSLLKSPVDVDANKTTS